MRELMMYVNLLRDLLKEGFKCERELQDALEILHKEMMPIMTSDESKFIIVLESNFEGVVKSVEVFKALMGNPQIVRHKGNDDHELRVGNVRVMIVKVNKYTTYLDKFRGYSPDYIINNADIDLVNLGLMIKD